MTAAVNTQSSRVVQQGHWGGSIKEVVKEAFLEEVPLHSDMGDKKSHVKLGVGTDLK